MKALTKIVIFLSISYSALGQEVQVSFWKKYIDADVKKLKIQKLEDTQYQLAIRIWINDYQVVELINEKDSTFNGQVINYLHKVNNREKKQQIVSQKHAISKLITKSLMTELIHHKIQYLPDSYEVEGYVNGLDGTTYIFEYKELDKYRIYSYWEPESDYQNSNLEEVKNVRKIIDELTKQFDLWRIFTKFKNSLPSGKYQYSGIIMTIK